MADITKPITRSLGGIWDLENPVIRWPAMKNT
jgi:hypothetical protein